MREKIEPAAAELSPDRVAAIKRAEAIANVILTERSDIIAVLVAQRLQDKTYENIAQDTEVADLLGTVGATTLRMRASVAWMVCDVALSKSLKEAINHRVLSNRSCHATPARLAAWEKGLFKRGMMYDWTDEIDRYLLRLEQTVLREKAPNKGRSDWQSIERIMYEKFRIKLKPQQWWNRAHYVKSKASCLQEGSSQTSADEQGL